MRPTLLFFLSLTGAALARAGTDTPHTRKYFYTGGQYVDDGTGNHIWTDQLYVEELTPVGGVRKEHPLVFIHGNGQTGTNWLNKPDGSPGWASFFFAEGYQLYIIDQTQRGRSPLTPALTNATSSFTAEVVQQHFTAPERYLLWPQAERHTQWPGSGVRGDPYFDAYYMSTVPSLNSALAQQTTMQAAGAQLLDRLRAPAVLIGHSQGGAMPWLLADARPERVRAIVALEPQGPPFREVIFTTVPARAYGLTDAPLTYDPPVQDPARDLVKELIPGNASAGVADCILQATSSSSPVRRLKNLQRIPTVVVTSEASYHATYDWCTVRYLQQAGVPAEHLSLPDVGIHGNGHMMFMEKNSDVLASKVNESIGRHQERLTS
ncbi:Alpha/beta hydrolase family-domain-containing protein [Daedaleopsis nitida]|nr:Alpha/beta hydrolase family-domain-containing protein [Daedaleopsis nitida]